MNYSSVFIMFIASFVLSYFVTENISIKRNITNNKHKLYMSLFMAFHMALIELLMYFYFMGTFNIYYLGILGIGCLWSGYQLATLRFLDDREYLLAMIEHHENAIAMSEAHDEYYQTRDPEIRKLIDGITKTQEMEINLMKKLLNK